MYVLNDTEQFLQRPRHEIWNRNFVEQTRPSFSKQWPIVLRRRNGKFAGSFFELVFPLKTNQRQLLWDQAPSLRTSIYLDRSSGEKTAPSPTN